jgi:hypothetical protein
MRVNTLLRAVLGVPLRPSFQYSNLFLGSHCVVCIFSTHAPTSFALDCNLFYAPLSFIPYSNLLLRPFVLYSVQ